MEEKDDIFFMQLAYKEAEKALDTDEVPIGAVIVSNNKVIAKAHNQTETLCDPTAHAEMLAITSATNFLNSRHLHKSTLYVTAEPCVMCAGALFWSQIGRIVYGTADNKKGFTVVSPNVFSSKTQISKGVLEEKCKDILQLFFKSIRR